jgi:hypothetical protein
MDNFKPCLSLSSYPHDHYPRRDKKDPPGITRGPALLKQRRGGGEKGEQRKKKSRASKDRGRENQRADEREDQNQAEQDTGEGILPSFKTPATHVPHR